MKIYNKLIVILLISLNSLYAQKPEFITPRETPSVGTRANCVDINAGTAALRPFSNGAALDNDGNITLCYGQGVSVQHDGDYNLDEDPDGSTPPGIRYAVFREEPTTAPEIVNSTALFDFVNLVTTEDGAMIVAQADANGNFTAINDGSFLEAAGLSAPQTLWFVPITVHNAEAGASNPEDFFEATNNDACTHINTNSAFAITYLGPLEYSVDRTSESAGTINVTGGLPESDGSNYSATLLNTATNENTVLSGSGNSFNYSGIDPDNSYQLTISDDQGCSRTFNLSFGSDEEPVEVSIPDTTVGEGSQICVPITTNNFTNIGSFSFAIRWNPGIIEFNDFGEIHADLRDFNSGSYNISQTDEGLIIFSWVTSTLTPINVPNNEVLFELCFTARGQVGQNTPVYFDNYNSTYIEFTTIDNPLPFSTIPGNITIVPEGDFDFSYSSCVQPGSSGLSNLNVAIFGGRGPYDYSLTGIDSRMGTIDSSGIEFQGLDAGDYTLELTDADGISTSKTFTISTNIQDIEIIPESNTCSAATPNGFVYIRNIDVEDYNIEWTYNNQKFFNVDTLQNIAGGPVSVSVTDQNNCTRTAEGEIRNLGLDYDENIIEDPSCDGSQPGTAEISISGGTPDYTITRTGYSETISGADPLTIEFRNGDSYVIEDVNGCAMPLSFDVDMETQSFTFRDTLHQNIGCDNSDGGVYRVYVESENTPIWEDVEVYYNGSLFTAPYIANQSTGQIWLRDLDAGDYTIEITGECGSFNHDFTIENISENLLLDATVTPVSCEAGSTGSIDLSVTPATGDYDFDWSSETSTGFFPNTEDLTNLEPGTYAVTVTSRETGCTIMDEFSLSPGVVYSKIEGEMPCEPGSSIEAGITIQSDYESLEWDSGEDTEIITVASPGYYPFTLTSTDETCDPIRDSIYVRSQSGGIDITNFTIVPVNGCDSPDAIVVVQMSIPLDSLNFSWDNGPLALDNNEYRVFNSDVHNLKIYNKDCLVVDTNFQAEFDDLIEIDSSSTNISCFGANDGEIDVEAIGGGGFGFDYQWSPDQGAFNPGRLRGLGPGTYDLTIVDNSPPDASPCPAIELTFEIEEPEELSVEVLEDQVALPSCEGDSNGVIVLDMVGGTPGDIEVRYSYSGGFNTTDSLVIENAVAGNYNFTLTDDRGCRASTQYQLMEPEPITFTVPPIEEPACFGYTTSLTIQNASGGTNTQYQFAVDGGVPSPLGQAIDIVGGSHTVTVFDENLCSASTAVTVREPNPISIQFNQPDTMQVPLGQTAEISARINGENSIEEYTWTPDGIAVPPAREDLEFTAIDNMFITLEVTDSRGCSAAKEIFVLVRKQRDIGIPNAFTPNGDGSNDLLTVIPGPGVQSIQSFQVYDRYGGLLWQQENINPAEAQITGWDGSVKGQRANPGLYLLLVKVEFIDGLVVQRREDVLLLK